MAKFSAYGLATDLVGAEVLIRQGPKVKRAPSGLFFSRGVQQSTITAQLTTGDESSIDTAFTGDWSHSVLPIEHRISGVDTAGQPTTGYTSRPEIMPVYVYSDNQSGWNQATGGNDGRTGIAQFRSRFRQRGGGDFYSLWASGSVGGARAGATHFLANPAGVVVGANLAAENDGVYLNPLEFALDDKGFDVSAIGPVINLARSNDTGALGTVWNGLRVQSTGAKAINAAYFASGLSSVGLDFSALDVSGYNQAAITLKKNQRIYGNAMPDGNVVHREPVLSNDYLDYSDTINGFRFVVGNVASLQIVSGQVTVVNATGLVIADPGVLKYLGDGTGSQFGTGAQTPSFAATNKPGTTGGAGPATWFKINLGGTVYYVPAWAA